jgi:osmoprotectant transport system permease protein
MIAVFQPALAPMLLGVTLAAASHPALARLLTGGAARPLAAERLLDLALNHLMLAGTGFLVVALLGLGLGIAATRPAFASLRPTIDTLAAFAQAVPPVVVVALALPILGFGGPSTLLALLAYGIMPVLRGIVGAIETVPAEARLAAEAIGFREIQILLGVELPLAVPGVIETLRTAVILSVSVAAVGALAGAPTLGTPIVAGLQNQNLTAMLQGTLATAALAFLGDGLIQAVGGMIQRR